jgi:outer membrane receptor protein involved in Fe transport
MKKKVYFILLFLMIPTVVVVAQTGKISGRVINSASGQVLANATLILVDKSKKEIADQNGNFSLGKLAAGTYSIKCSFVGYDEKIVDEIIVKENETTVITISLDEHKALSQEVVITTKRVSAARESVSSLLVAQKNNASVSDGISAESIRKTPDRSASDVLKRVSGASIQDDRFAIIRGLNDRYNAAFINGAPLPSTESDRKAFAFDIFPSAILDNLIIYKTATPDKNGEFAGGIIDISTKSIPSKNFTSVSFGLGYNTFATGKNRYFSETKGSRDWLGSDDGTRALPAGMPSPAELKNVLTFSQRADLAKQFGKYKWGVLQGNASPDFSFQFSQGLNVERKQKEFLGALFSINYKRSYSFNEGERSSYGFDLTAPIDGPLDQKRKNRDSVYNNEVVIAALANIAVKLDNRNNISWKNNYSINTDDKLIKRTGFPDYTYDPTVFSKETVRWFTSNKIFCSQLLGEHQAGPVKTKLSWLASFSKIKRDIPHLSRTAYTGFLPDETNLYPSFSSPPAQSTGMGTMFFSKLNESIKSIKVDIIQPYTLLKNSQNILKIGSGYQVRKRDVASRTLGFTKYENGVEFDNSLLQLPESQIFLPEHLGLMENGKGGFRIDDGTLPNSDYDASSALTHVYIMNDQRLIKKIRLVYGVRMEKFNQKMHSVKNLSDTINPNVTDYLPSANIVFAATAKMNVRLSYSKTVNRPEFRELAPFLFYDFVTQFTYEGFEDLQRATINNYDFRYEFFPGKSQLFSVSAFYKEFKNPIELRRDKNNPDQALYQNALSAKNYGVEAEFRTLISTLFGIKNEDALLSKFTLAANAAYIKSIVKLPDGFFSDSKFNKERALQGQSPYLINGSLTFNDDKTGFSSTLSVNRVGDRIFLAGTERDPDIYEKARTVVDFQLAKFFLKNKLEVKFNARDILAQNISFYFDADQTKSFTGRDKYLSSYTAPKVFNISATYKF